MAARLRAAATATDRAPLASPDSLRRYIRDYEAGRHFPRDYAGLYCRVFGMTRAQLLADGADPAASSAPAADACDAASLAAWMESTNTSDDALDYLAEAAESLAECHPVLAPRDALQRVLEVHGRAHGLLLGKQRLGQRRALFGTARPRLPAAW